MLVALSLFACKKDLAGNETPLPDIRGRWELRRSVGGWGGDQSFVPGNGTILEYTNSLERSYTGGRLQSTRVYRLLPDTTWSGIAGVRIITDTASWRPRTFVSLREGLLWFRTEIVDVGSVAYERIP
ncbi:hypothetical protein GCM10023184_26280 [Flaviaesturariibacter amylovorans]|uniref:Lipocalin-like domain-containing protein n=2 Tax=Flaviaesturariibacter amylovorans TaxID=1084520 RepID=A0ABP8H230_9BACT